MCTLSVGKFTFKQYIFKSIKEIFMKECVTSAPSVRSPLSRSPAGINSKSSVLVPNILAVAVDKISLLCCNWEPSEKKHHSQGINRQQLHSVEKIPSTSRNEVAARPSSVSK